MLITGILIFGEGGRSYENVILPGTNSTGGGPYFSFLRGRLQCMFPNIQIIEILYKQSSKETREGKD